MSVHEESNIYSRIFIIFHHEADLYIFHEWLSYRRVGIIHNHLVKILYFKYRIVSVIFIQKLL